MSLKNLTRREFVRRSTLLAASGAGAPWALNLAAIGEAAAQAGGGDYRAIVCVFLYGGNDYGNTLVPYDIDNYNRYQAIRPTIAVTRDSLLNTTLTGATTGPGTVLAAGRQYALAAQLAPLKPVFDAGKMGVLLNIGPLIQPTTLAQYNARNVPLPPKLFSHNDQQSVWQSSLAEGATSGWGGRIGDLFLGSNGNSTFTCVNVSGNAVFMSGQTAVQYQVSTGGSVALNGIQNTLFGSAACASTLRTLVTATRTNLIENEHTRVMNRSIAANVQLSPALTAVPTTTAPFDTFNTFNTAPASNPLAAQLQLVARMIAARTTLGATRQVFFVSLGGFDTHDFLTAQHPGLLTNVANALKTFYDATVALGVANNVTTFTASDFGRTLSSNGDGSDHGWGSHHFVLGGAVQGQRFYGQAPAVAAGGPDDVGQGRLLPTTSVDQLASTLALWMGVPASNLTTVAPNVGNFATANLGFLA